MGIFNWLSSIFQSEPNRSFHSRNAPPPDVGHDIGELAQRLDLTVDELKQFQPKYRRIYLPKRGSQEKRAIDAPEPETKAMQRRILRRLLARLRVHPAAAGFRPNYSIVDNAIVHVGQAVVLKIDIRGFFGSTSDERVWDYFRQIGWNKEAADWLVLACCLNRGLPQGAPTSPMISNLVNHRLDARLSSLAASMKNRTSPDVGKAETNLIIYTRYADDMTFSFSRDDQRVRSLLWHVRSIVEDEGYRLNSRKTRVLRSHQRQIVTGLVVNKGVNLPREQRRKLRAIRHQRALGRPVTLTDDQLQGWDAVEQMVTARRGH